MVEYIDREAVYAEACRGCIRHGEHIGECYSEEPCQKLIEVFALAPAVDLIPAVCKESSGEQSKWISVKERLPKRGEKVLCYMKYEPDSSDIICDNTYNGPLVGTRGKTHVWQFDSDFVTHWMPLPEPPDADSIAEKAYEQVQGAVNQHNRKAMRKIAAFIESPKEGAEG